MTTQNETTFTPGWTEGPWRTSKPDEDGWFWPAVYTEEGFAIAEAIGDRDFSERQANAHLIAAAPDGYEFASTPPPLGNYLRWCNDGNEKDAAILSDYEAKRQAYLKKARGEPS